MKQLLLIAVIVVLSSCGAKKTRVSEKTTVKDSTVVTFQPIDTIIKTPGESLKIVKPVNEISHRPTIKQGKRTRLSVSMLDNILTVNCETEALEQKIRLLQKQVDHYREELTSIETVVPEKYVPKLVKILAWIGGLFVLYIIGRIVYFIIKPKLF